MKIVNLFKNEKQWYLMQVTQEGALKLASIFNQIVPSGELAIVTTYENCSTDPQEIRNRDVIFHIKLSPKQMEILQEFVGDYIVVTKPIEG